MQYDLIELAIFIEKVSFYFVAERVYRDLVTQTKFLKKEDFVEQLTHNAYMIQIPRLWKKDRNDIERMLKVFHQSYKWSEDRRLIEISEEELNRDPLLKKMGQRLIRAAANEEVLQKIDLEEEVEQMIEKYLRKYAVLKEEVEEKDKALEEKDKVLEERDKVLEEKDKVLEEKDKALEEKEKVLAEMKVKLIQ